MCSHMVNSDDSPWRELSTVKTATAVVEMLAELNAAGVTEVAEQLDIPKSSAHAQLSTLETTGYLTRNGSEYELSPQLLLLGEHVRNGNPLFQFGREQAEALAEETGHYSHLFIEEDGLGVNIYEARGELAGDYSYQSLKLQRKEPLHITATGKAILAELPDARVDEIINKHGLESRTEHTISDRAELLDDLKTAKERGFTVNDEEEVEGFRAVGAPVCVDDGTILGAISVSGPKAFFDAERFEVEMPKRVTRAANMIEVSYNMAQ